MNASPETQAIRVEYELPHSPGKIWRTLTEPQLLAKWLMANDIEPRVGHSFTFRQEPTAWWDGIVHCEVLEVETERRLSYTWQGGPETSRIDTVVTWTLTPMSPSGTRLTLDHAGFLPTDRFAFEGARKGWGYMAGQRLGKVLAEL